jgi:hypothetical protein
MNSKSHVSRALASGIAIGIAMLGSTGKAETSAPEESSAQPSQAAGQQRVAETTQKLESAFNDQFVKGKIDPTALAGAINDVVSAMPEEARPKVKAHIDDVLKAGTKVAAQLTPEQRAQVAAPPSAENVGKTVQAQVAAWGWPGYAGWGGCGAFGFPSMYAVGWGMPAYAASFGPFGGAWGSTTGYSSGYSTGYSYGFGYPMGWGGWYW